MCFFKYLQIRDGTTNTSASQVTVMELKFGSHYLRDYSSVVKNGPVSDLVKTDLLECSSTQLSMCHPSMAAFAAQWQKLSSCDRNHMNYII